MVEAPEDLQAYLKIPEDHLQACKSQNIATAGNAAGRTDDLLNLEGATHPPARLPDGFTARGIVALVFSILAAFIGLAVISWYASCIPSLIFVRRMCENHRDACRSGIECLIVLCYTIGTVVPNSPSCRQIPQWAVW